MKVAPINGMLRRRPGASSASSSDCISAEDDHDNYTNSSASYNSDDGGRDSDGLESGNPTSVGEIFEDASTDNNTAAWENAANSAGNNRRDNYCVSQVPRQVNSDCNDNCSVDVNGSHVDSDDDLENQFKENETDNYPGNAMPSNIRFRPIDVKDRIQIQALHEEWFPVTYQKEFYDELVKHRLASSGDPLYTCVAVTTKNGTNDNHVASASSDINQKNDDDSIDPLESEETIIGCVVGTFLSGTRLNMETQNLLVPNYDRHKRLFYIMTLGTVKKYRHLGIATTLVQKVIELVQQDTGCGALYLHVIPFNTAAIRFYERLGFYRVKEIQDYYTIKGRSYNCYLYAKYFHGNLGHRTLFMILTNTISKIWNEIIKPIILPQLSVPLLGAYNNNGYNNTNNNISSSPSTPDGIEGDDFLECYYNR